MVILLVGLEVILQLVDVGAQQSYLNLRGTGIAITLLKIFNDLSFLTGNATRLLLGLGLSVDIVAFRHRV